MVSKHKNLIKALVIMVFIAIGLFQGAFFYVKNLVKPEAYQQQILESIKQQTGQNVKINGDIRFMLFPSPRLVFSDLEVDSSLSNISTVPSFSIKKVEVHIELMSILTDQIKLSKVKLINPVLSLERADDNTIHWDWLNLKLLKVLNTKNGIKNGNGVSLPLFIVDGIISYNDSINNRNYLIKDINASTNYGSQISLNGTMKSGGRLLDFAIDSKVADLPVNDVEFPLNLHLSDADKNVLTVQSVIDSSGDIPKVVGNFNLNADDMGKLAQDADAKNIKNDEDYVAMPLVVDGLWNIEDDSLQMKNITVKGMNSDGKGSASLRWNNWYPTISVEIDFDYIDHPMWKRLSEVRTVQKSLKKNEIFQSDDGQNFDYHKDNPLPENIEIKLNINAKKVLSGKEEWRNISLNAVLDKGAFTVNQCDIFLNGDGLLSIFGVVSQGGDGELRFEGNMEAKGTSLREAIAMFYSSASDLPTIGTGEFSVSANLYMNASQVRLFEANAMIEGTPILGTMTAYLGSQLRIDTTIKLKDINLDHVRDKLRKQSIEAAKKLKDAEDKIKVEDKIKGDEETDTDSKKTGFDWLKYLSTRIDATVYIDDFTFMERKGDRVSFSLYAYGGDLRITNLQLTYPDGISELNCNLDVRGAVPHINLMVNADQIDARYFYMSEQSEDVPASPKDNLSQKNNNAKTTKKKPDLEKIVELRDISTDTPVPLGWMDGFNGVFDITLRKLIFKNVFMDKIKFRGKLDNKRLDIQKLSFIYSQAQTDIIGILYGGKVPGINVSFTMANADIYEIIKPITDIENINGFASLSGIIATNGWSFHEWLEQMDAKLLIAARGVKVQGINIAGVSNVVDVARTSADVFNNVNNVLTKGSTEFLVDGSMNIKDGELRLPSLTIRSGLVSGSIVGGTKLETMVGQFSILFRFGNFLASSVPTMIIQLSGKMDKPDIKVDTASLEDFVAKRNVSK